MFLCPYNGNQLIESQFQVIVYHQIPVPVHLFDFAPGVAQPALNLFLFFSVPGMETNLQVMITGWKDKNAYTVRFFLHHSSRALGIDVQQYVLSSFHPRVHFAFEGSVTIAVDAGVLDECVLVQQFIIFRVRNKVVMYIFNFIFTPGAGGYAD